MQGQISPQQHQASAAEAGPQTAHMQHVSGNLQPADPRPQVASSGAALPEQAYSAAPSRPQPLRTDMLPLESAQDAPNVSPRLVVASPADVLAQFGLLTMGHDSGQSPTFISDLASQQRRADSHQTGGNGSADPSAAGHDPEADDNGDEDCIFCWFAAPSIIFQPCGHLCCCDHCAQPMLKGSIACPMCRVPVVSGINITML